MRYCESLVFGLVILLVPVIQVASFDAWGNYISTVYNNLFSEIGAKTDIIDLKYDSSKAIYLVHKSLINKDRDSNFNVINQNAAGKLSSVTQNFERILTAGSNVNNKFAGKLLALLKNHDIERHIWGALDNSVKDLILDMWNFRTWVFECVENFNDELQEELLNTIKELFSKMQPKSYAVSPNSDYQTWEQNMKEAQKELNKTTNECSSMGTETCSRILFNTLVTNFVKVQKEMIEFDNITYDTAMGGVQKFAAYKETNKMWSSEKQTTKQEISVYCTDEGKRISKSFSDLFQKRRWAVHNSILEIQYNVTKKIHSMENSVAKCRKDYDNLWNNVNPENLNKLKTDISAGAGGFGDNIPRLLGTFYEFIEVESLVPKSLPSSKLSFEDILANAVQFWYSAEHQLNNAQDENRELSWYAVENCFNKIETLIKRCDVITNGERPDPLSNTISTIIQILETVNTEITSCTNNNNNCEKESTVKAFNALSNIQDLKKKFRESFDANATGLNCITCYEGIKHQVFDYINEARGLLNMLTGSHSYVLDKLQILKTFNELDDHHSDILGLEHQAAEAVHSSKDVIYTVQENIRDIVKKNFDDHNKAFETVFTKIVEGQNLANELSKTFSKEHEFINIMNNINTFYTQTEELIKSFNLNEKLNHFIDIKLKYLPKDIKSFWVQTERDLRNFNFSIYEGIQSDLIVMLEDTAKEIGKCSIAAATTSECGAYILQKWAEHFEKEVSVVTDQNKICKEGKSEEVREKCATSVRTQAAQSYASMHKNFEILENMLGIEVMSQYFDLECYSKAENEWQKRKRTLTDNINKHKIYNFDEYGMLAYETFKKIHEMHVTHFSDETSSPDHEIISALHSIEMQAESLKEGIRNSIAEADSAVLSKFTNIFNLIADTEIYVTSHENQLIRNTQNPDETKKITEHIKEILSDFRALLEEFNFHKFMEHSDWHGIDGLTNDIRDFQHWASEQLRPMNIEIYKKELRICRDAIQNVGKQLKDCTIQDKGNSCHLKFIDNLSKVLDKTIGEMKNTMEKCAQSSDVQCAESLTQSSIHKLHAIEKHFKKFNSIALSELMGTVYDFKCVKDVEIQWYEKKSSLSETIVQHALSKLSENSKTVFNRFHDISSDSSNETDYRTIESETRITQAVHLLDEYVKPILERIYTAAIVAENDLETEVQKIRDELKTVNQSLENYKLAHPDYKDVDVPKILTQFVEIIEGQIKTEDYDKLIKTSIIYSFKDLIHDMEHFWHNTTKIGLKRDYFEEVQYELNRIFEYITLNIQDCEVEEDPDGLSCHPDFILQLSDSLIGYIKKVVSKIDTCTAAGIHEQTDCIDSIPDNVTTTLTSIYKRTVSFKKIAIPEVIDTVHDVKCLTDMKTLWDASKNQITNLIQDFNTALSTDGNNLWETFLNYAKTLKIRDTHKELKLKNRYHILFQLITLENTTEINLINLQNYINTSYMFSDFTDNLNKLSDAIKSLKQKLLPESQDTKDANSEKFIGQLQVIFAEIQSALSNKKFVTEITTKYRNDLQAIVNNMYKKSETLETNTLSYVEERLRGCRVPSNDFPFEKSDIQSHITDITDKLNGCGDNNCAKQIAFDFLNTLNEITEKLNSEFSKNGELDAFGKCVRDILSQT